MKKLGYNTIFVWKECRIYAFVHAVLYNLTSILDKISYYLGNLALRNIYFVLLLQPEALWNESSDLAFAVSPVCCSQDYLGIGAFVLERFRFNWLPLDCSFEMGSIIRDHISAKSVEGSLRMNK